MKRVVVSLFLLAAVFLMSELFMTESSYPVGHASLQSYSTSPTDVTDQPPFVGNFLYAEDCSCDASGHPTLALILLAALASSLAMATFIYGSHFIAALVAG